MLVKRTIIMNFLIFKMIHAFFLKKNKSKCESGTDLMRANVETSHLCDVSTTALPSWRTLSMAFHRKRREWGSIPVVGSS